MCTLTPLEIEERSEAGFISEKLTRGGEPHVREILGGNMKTHCEVSWFQGLKMHKYSVKMSVILIAGGPD